MVERRFKDVPTELPDGLDARLVLDAAPVMIWVSSQDKLCNWFNRPWLTFTGRSMRQELGNGWTQGVHPDDFDRCLRIYASQFDDRKEFRMQYRLRRYDGAYRWIDDIGIPRYARDRTFLGYIGSCIDIHDQQEAQAKLRRHLLEVAHLNRSADAAVLGATISHELNQPLTAIMADTEAAKLLLTANPPDLDQLKEILADIRRDSRRAADVISHVRGLFRKNELRLEEINLNDVVRTVCEIIAPHAADKGVLLSADQEQGALPVRADPIHMQQVILNLALNGFDAMLSSMPRERRLVLQTALVKTSTVEVSVSDSGAGIPADKLESIFEPFFTTKQQGTGLGLPIARAIIEIHGGRIWAENRVGGGAVFRFTLPSAKTLPA
jgi:PAS domain S-box-containing protein